MCADLIRIPLQRTRRWTFLGLVGATTAAGSWMMVRTVGASGVTPLEIVILALFVPTFAWITVPFWTAVAGFALRIVARDPLTLRPAAHAVPGRPVDSLTALVIPVFDEDPATVSRRISAMVRSLLANAVAPHFHVHILSDTQDMGIARGEEEAWVRLQSRFPEIPIRYRRRERNVGRKVGNIDEFCRRCGSDYDFMVVLDADSLMTGATLSDLAGIMEANPDVGLVQTVPLPVMAKTLFGRLIQFAGCLYSPMLAAGQSFWYGDAANYWGHNAILRVQPFRDHAQLPVLPGRPPLGGEVLSHDFVEAALLRRAGWKVLLHATAPGSWEEVPGTLADFVKRDRRWAQGSLQHVRLLALPGLHPLGRAHFALGAMAYVSSLLWLLILAAGSAYVLVPALHGPSRSIALPGPAIPVSLLAVTAGLLFLPKLMGLVEALARRRTGFGGGVRLTASVLLEASFSIVVAPIVMLEHARFVAGIALGRSVAWRPQRRDAAPVSPGEAWRSAVAPTILGILWGGTTLAVSPAFFLWMSPIFVGLAGAWPLVWWTSRVDAGTAAQRRGLLLVPSEVEPPTEVRTVQVSPNEGVTSNVSGPTGVHLASGAMRWGYSRSAEGASRSMINAKRGLFDLREGRPLLVTDSRPDGSITGATLVMAVEALSPAGLDLLRTMADRPIRLALTGHRVAAMDLSPSPGGDGSSCYSLPLDEDADLDSVLELGCGQWTNGLDPVRDLSPATANEAAGLALVRLGRMLPAVVSLRVTEPFGPALRAELDGTSILRVSVREIEELVDTAGIEVVPVGEASVPLAEAADSRFVLFRESQGLYEHVAIIVGNQDEWPDPVPVRLHSACLTGDLFGSLRCDCGDQLRGSMKYFAARSGGILLYLAQEGRGIGLRNKFRAYTLQESGLDTIDADRTLGFGADERNYQVAAQILQSLGVDRIDLLTNNPEKVQAMEDAGINVVHRSPLHGRLNRHNLPYVRAKVQRAGHWLNEMLSQPLSGD
jgi:membrane glycosyltransferase